MMYAFHNARHAIGVLRKKLERRWLRLKMLGRPEAEVLAAERRLRGTEQYGKLREADLVIVSFGKSGRTWLRVMLSHLFCVKHGLPKGALLSFDNFRRMNPAVPKIFFTHDNYIKDFTGDAESKRPFYDKRVVLLARDPRDTAVSQYFQWKYRLKPSKVAINNYPPLNESNLANLSKFDFVTGDNGGSMQAAVEFLNLWAEESRKLSCFHLLRYEDLRKNPHAELRCLLEFMQVRADACHVNAAVKYADFKKMKKREENAGRSPFAGGRVRRGKRGKQGDSDGRKTRRGKVGGYRDDFSDEEKQRIDAALSESLHPMYRYK